jgi:hypothetical protein
MKHGAGGASTGGGGGGDGRGGHCPFPMECFGGWGKGEPSEARGWGGQHGRGRGGTNEKGSGRGGRTGREGSGGGGTGGEGPGEGELDGCIMHRVHTYEANVTCNLCYELHIFMTTLDSKIRLCCH